MYESIYKNNELENDMTLDMSYFWYSDEGLDDFYTCSDSIIWLSYYTPSYIPSLLQCMYF